MSNITPTKPTSQSQTTTPSASTTGSTVQYKFKKSGTSAIKPKSKMSDLEKEKWKNSVARSSIVQCKQILLEQQFSLPDNFQERITILEDDLEKDRLTGDKLIELINLYSVSYII